jgi:hypothetical protein
LQKTLKTGKMKMRRAAQIYLGRLGWPRGGLPLLGEISPGSL